MSIVHAPSECLPTLKMLYKGHKGVSLLGLWHDELSEVGGDGLELPVEQVLLELAVSAGAGERGHLGEDSHRMSAVDTEWDTTKAYYELYEVY